MKLLTPGETVMEGAWVTVLLIPLMLAGMVWVRRHYDRVASETATRNAADFSRMHPPLTIALISHWSRITEKALRFAYTVSHDVRAVHVSAGDETDDSFCQNWASLAQEPARQAGLPPPDLVVLESPYRWVLTPILEYILKVEKENPDRQIAVVLPEMVERHWYHYFLHNQRAEVLKTWLLLKGNQRIIVINVPWYLLA